MDIQNKTKIICSISDLHCEVEFLKELYESGMNIVRINSAHASIEAAQSIVDNVRKVSDKIAILIDTKGPEVRLTATEKPFPVTTGEIIEIHDDTTKTCVPGHLYTSYPHISRDIPVGTHMLIDDGSLDLLVKEQKETSIICEVQNDGKISSRKSVNVPRVNIPLPALTEKDKTFINWAIDADIDFIAHSFVRSAADLKEIQAILDARGSHLKLISKIENEQGLDNLDEILSNCYGVMVARGDLGVEIPTEHIPLIQKKIVHTCRERKKPVIVATQMLQSMIENPRPTRAEVTDVANAIFQAADAIMLSGETASGKYPVEAVKTMTKIARENERAVQVNLELNHRKVIKPVAAVLAKSLVSATLELPIKAIVFDTFTGRVGRYLSSFHPRIPLYAMCYSPHTMRELSLVRGIYPIPFGHVSSKEEFTNNSIEILKQTKRVKNGDLVGFVGGDFNDKKSGATYMEIKTIE